MIRSTSLPFVLKASSPAASKSRKVRRMSLWSSLSMTMASVDMVGLLGGFGLRARASGAEVGGRSEASDGRVLAQSQDLALHRVERDLGVVAGGREEQHAEEVPRPGRPRPGQVVGPGLDALRREQQRTPVGVVGQEGRHRAAARAPARGEHEPGDPTQAGRGEEEVAGAPLDRHPYGEAVDVGQAARQPDRARASYQDVVLTLVVDPGDAGPLDRAPPEDPAADDVAVGVQRLASGSQRGHAVRAGGQDRAAGRGRSLTQAQPSTVPNRSQTRCAPRAACSSAKTVAGSSPVRTPGASATPASSSASTPAPQAPIAFACRKHSWSSRATRGSRAGAPSSPALLSRTTSASAAGIGLPASRTASYSTDRVAANVRWTVVPSDSLPPYG